MRESLQPRRRRFRRAPDEKRARIIAVARACFSERSYDDTTTAEIARRADVSEGTIFHHFGTKLHLLRQVAEQYAADLAEAMFPSDDDFSTLDVTLERAYAFVRQEGTLGIRPARDGSAQPLLVVHGALREALVDRGTQILEAWGARGLVRKMENPRLVAEILFPVFEGLLARVFTPGGKAISPEFVAEATRCIDGAIDLRRP